MINFRIVGSFFRGKALGGVCFVVFLVNIFFSFAQAAELELLAPTGDLEIREGREFSFRELKNRWDFNERRDIGYEEQFHGTSIDVQNGIWKGIQLAPGSYVFPLFGGFFGSLQTEGVSGDKTVPALGANHPINAATYYYLSYRVRHSARSTYAIYWNNDNSRTLWPDGSAFRANYDGTYLGSGVLNDGFTVYGFDLREGAFERASGTWAGNIYALRLDASIAAGEGSAWELDWLRLSDPYSAPFVKVAWKALEMPEQALITVWLDDSHSLPSPLARFSHRQGSSPAGALWQTSPVLARSQDTFSFPSSMLPPGRYRFFVTAHQSVGGRLIEIARSEKSSSLVINEAPTAVFSAPSQISGQDYASVETGNPWDMNDAADISNLPESGQPYPLRQYSSPSFAGGVFQAVADEPLFNLGNQQSDAQVHLRIPAARPVSSGRYRYLTYRLGADESHFPGLPDKVRHGWVARPVFWNNDVIADGGSLRAHTVYEGMKTYTIDLWQEGILERGSSWKSLPQIRSLRIDPLETSIPTWFFLDWVMLTSPNSPTEGSYNLVFEVEDSDDSRVDVSVYYDRDRHGFDGKLIKTFADRNTGSLSMVWDTSSLPDGEYYPYVTISDGNNQTSWYSAVPIVVGGKLSVGARGRAPLDYDGDGISDFVVYRPDSGNFYSRLSSQSVEVRRWGGPGSHALAGDFDGDGRQDYAVVFAAGSSLHWFVIFSSDGALYYRMWGYPGDQAAVGDWDGDGSDDIAIFRDGAWYVLFKDNSAKVVHWGEQGDVPVAADYDGDGISDAAIFRPNDGTWWVLYSGDGSPGYQTTQWGLPGDVPLKGDFNGDKRSDFIVWRPSFGTWYLQHNDHNRQTQAVQWGLFGDVPVLGDFSGDASLEYAVWRPGDGTWYVRNQSASSFVQWGLPGDFVPSSLAVLR